MRRVDWKGSGTDMSFDFLTVAATAFLVIGPFVALAVASIRFGADSRPGIDDGGRHRWMPGG
jgi:hypothetical protein